MVNKFTTLVHVVTDISAKRFALKLLSRTNSSGIRYFVGDSLILRKQ